MEREILFTGIGGQGVQLMARVMASAALLDARQVQLFGSYGGMMRGGNTGATLVIGEDDIVAPPTGGAAWCAVLMHHEYAAGTVGRVTADGGVFVNASAWEGPTPAGPAPVYEISATDIAIDLGNQLAAGMVMLGAVVAATNLVGMDALRTAARESVPAYRSQHIELNERALAAGAEALGGRKIKLDAWAGAGSPVAR